MQEWARKIRTVIIGATVTGALLLPLFAHALGFGSIKVKSALNEPLDAEIELISATDDEVKDLEVKLASREAFLRAGVDRSAQLGQIKFSIVKRSGTHYVVLRTPASVRDPFLNFLLEMNWKNGRMLREYTVLLDPPDRKPVQMAAAPEPTPPAVEPVIQPEPAPVAVTPVAPTPAPVFVEPAPVTPAPTEVAKADDAALAPVAPVTPAVDAVPPAPEATAAPAAETVKPAADKKTTSKKKKTSKKDTKAKGAKAAEAPVPSTEAAIPAAIPSADVAGATPGAMASKDDGLFPRIPLDENNEIDAKALEAAIKQSQQARKDEVIEVEPAPVPVPAPAAGPGEIARADAPAETPAPIPVSPVDGGESSVTAAPAGALDYGITRKGDILWDIAKKLKPSDEVTVYQVMMALQQSNPDAFVKGNVHRLKANQVLRIEDPRLLTAMSREQAVSRYQEQTREWKDYLASVGAQVPRQAIVAGDAGTTADAGSGVTAGELKLTPPAGEGEGAGTGGSDKLAKKQNTEQLRKDVQKAVKEAESERSKNKELAGRVEDLEKELKRLENLVTIKDSDLAALQQKLKEVEKSRASAKDAKAAPLAAVEPPKPEVKAPEPVKPEPVVAPAEVEQPKPVDVAAATPAQDAMQPVPDAAVTPAPVTEPADKAVTPAPQPKPVATTSTGILATVKGMFGGMGLYVAIGGVVVLLLIALLFVWIRRRNRIHFQESILKGGAAPGDSQLGAAASSIINKPVSTQSSLMTGGGESSFLSDFAISGVSAIQAEDSEVDPLTEADVFMAYGRYEAAEERLNEAIKHDPKRGELRVKLLELYSTTKNKKAFEAAAEEYYASLGGQAAGNALWQKAVSMGMDIAPNNPLFKGGASGGGGFTSTSNLNDSKVMDIGLDTGAFSKSDFALPEDKTVVKPKPAPAAPPADFNLDFDVQPAKSAAPAAKADDDALDFNLDFGTTTAATGTSPASGGGGMDFNLDKDEEPTATDIKFDMADSSGGLDFDLESPGPKAESSNRTTMEMNLDATDAINLDMPAGGDEVGTKLDLARAYIDMGDPDGARSILDEVIAEGNEGQKQEAKQLISQIG